MFKVVTYFNTVKNVRATYMNTMPLAFLLDEILANAELEPEHVVRDRVFEEEESFAILDGRLVHLVNLQLQQVLILNWTLKNESVLN